jgi:hypothetical protein
MIVYIFLSFTVPLNEKKRYGAVQDLGFYKMRWILKFSFKHRLMNEIEIFKIWFKQA